VRRHSKRVETKSLTEDEQSQHKRYKRMKHGVPRPSLPNTQCHLLVMSIHCVEVDDSNRDLAESVPGEGPTRSDGHVKAISGESDRFETSYKDWIPCRSVPEDVIRKDDGTKQP
jgi:hypothetical protein